MSDDDIYKAPESTLVDSNNTKKEVELASLWLRFAGAMIDGILFIMLLLPVAVQLGLLDDALAGHPPNFLTNITMSAISLVLYVLLNGYLLATNGQTIAKRILGTKIVSYKTNEILPLSKIMAYRVLPIQLLSLIPVVGPWMGLVDPLSIFGEDRRCIHDYLAGTQVIKIQQV